MNGEKLRKALRRYGRSQMTGFFLGGACLMVWFVIWAYVGKPVSELVGESTGNWIFGIFAFACLLVPPWIVQWLVTKDPGLYCPHCGNTFTSIRAIVTLNRKSICRRCETKIDVAPIDKRQARLDSLWIIGTVWGLVGVMWVVLQWVKSVTTM